MFTRVAWLVNGRSGSNQGASLLSTLRAIPDVEVCDLGNPLGPHELLSRAHLEPRTARWLLVCAGGDGTVAWVLTALDGYEWNETTMPRPCLSILPLGTGNDLARSLGYGPGWSGAESGRALLDLVLGGPRNIQPHDRQGMMICVFLHLLTRLC
jgi:diacylglycerol kinase (ATP)